MPMTASTVAADTAVDPSLMEPASWRARRAALMSHGAALDDPAVIECDEAMAYWRVRRVVDAQRDTLNPAHIPALADMLRHPHGKVNR